MEDVNSAMLDSLRFVFRFLWVSFCVGPGDVSFLMDLYQLVYTSSLFFLTNMSGVGFWILLCYLCFVVEIVNFAINTSIKKKTKIEVYFYVNYRNITHIFSKDLSKSYSVLPQFCSYCKCHVKEVELIATNQALTATEKLFLMENPPFPRSLFKPRTTCSANVR